jgi:Mor family transcriptional regulator
MLLTDDQYILQIGSWTRVMSRSESRARLKAGYEKRCREEPGWQKEVRATVDIQWSQEDRQEQSAKMKALWASPEYSERRAAAVARLQAANIPPMTDKTRDMHRNRMLMGGAHKALAARKIMTPEAIAEREERNASIVRNYYRGKMKATAIAKLYGLDLSHVYKIIREVELD